MNANYLDLFIFVALPYASVLLFLVGTIQRYWEGPFTYSSLSSQFLENRQHFWGLVPFHYGLIAVLTGHLIGFFVPSWVLAFNSKPLRLYILETSALIFAVLTLIGLVQLIYRRLTDPKIKSVTSVMDWVILILLLIQVLAGIGTATVHPWGSSWFAATAVPYLWSLLWLNPNLAAVSQYPWLIKVHMAGAFLLAAVFPFTRLVHLLVFPTPYLWRRPQVVRWYSRQGGGV